MDIISILASTGGLFIAGSTIIIAYINRVPAVKTLEVNDINKKVELLLSGYEARIVDLTKQIKIQENQIKEQKSIINELYKRVSKLESRAIDNIDKPIKINKMTNYNGNGSSDF